MLLNNVLYWLMLRR